MRMIQPLQKLQLIVDHLLISAHALLEDDFNGDFALRGVGFADDAVGASAEGSTESVQRPEHSQLAFTFQTAWLSTYFFS